MVQQGCRLVLAARPAPSRSSAPGLIASPTRPPGRRLGPPMPTQRPHGEQGEREYLVSLIRNVNWSELNSGETQELLHMAPDVRTRREIHSQVRENSPGSAQQLQSGEMSRSASDLQRVSSKAAPKREVVPSRSPDRNGEATSKVARVPPRSPKSPRRTAQAAGPARSPETAPRAAPTGIVRWPESLAGTAPHNSRLTWPRAGPSGNSRRSSPCAPFGSPNRAPFGSSSPRSKNQASPSGSPAPPSPRVRPGVPPSPGIPTSAGLPPPTRRRSGTERASVPAHRSSTHAQSASSGTVLSSGAAACSEERASDGDLEISFKDVLAVPPNSPSTPEVAPPAPAGATAAPARADAAEAPAAAAEAAAPAALPAGTAPAEPPPAGAPAESMPLADLAPALAVAPAPVAAQAGRAPAAVDLAAALAESMPLPPNLDVFADEASGPRVNSPRPQRIPFRENQQQAVTPPETSASDRMPFRELQSLPVTPPATSSLDRIPFREIQPQAVTLRSQQQALEKKSKSFGVRLSALSASLTSSAGGLPGNALGISPGSAPGIATGAAAPHKVLQRSAECRSLGFSQDDIRTPRPARQRPTGSVACKEPLMFTYGHCAASNAGCTEEPVKPWSCWGSVTTTGPLVAEPSTSTQSTWSLGVSEESPGTWSTGFGSIGTVDAQAEAGESLEGNQSQETRESMVSAQTMLSMRGIESPPPDSHKEVLRETTRAPSPQTPSTPFFGSAAAKSGPPAQFAAATEMLAGANEMEQIRKTQSALADALQQLRHNTSLLRLANEEMSGPTGQSLNAMSAAHFQDESALPADSELLSIEQAEYLLAPPCVPH